MEPHTSFQRCAQCRTIRSSYAFLCFHNRDADFLRPGHGTLGWIRDNKRSRGGHRCCPFLVSVSSSVYTSRSPDFLTRPCSYYGFYDIAWTPLPVSYTAEILPFGLRTKGLAIFTSVGTMANSFNQFVNPVALQALTWK